MNNFERSLVPLLVKEFERRQPVFQVLTGPRLRGGRGSGIDREADSAIDIRNRCDYNVATYVERSGGDR